MHSPCTELVPVPLTPEERTLLEALADARRVPVSELLRELLGLESEREVTRRGRGHLRLISA